MRSPRVPLGLLGLVASGALLAAAGAPAATAVADRNTPDAIRQVHRTAVVDLGRIAAEPSAAVSAPPRTANYPEPHKLRAGLDTHSLPAAVAGGAAAAPVGSLVNGGGTANGWNGLGIVAMEKAGSGAYAGTNGGLEPPDQALCVGNGYVVEGVNTAITVYRDTGVQATKPVPLTQFLKITPAGQATTSSFTSDPRCIYDAATHRFIMLILQIDESSGISQIPFLRSHTYFAVSKTSNPTGEWYIYGFDVTDDGTNGTPMHPSCPCIDDQPLLGSDANGIYITANEYSDAEVLPVAPPSNVPLNAVFGTLPDFRNGQSQAYAIPKASAENGTFTVPAVSFDTQNTPLPAGAPTGATWSELQPAWNPPLDGTVEPAGGVEYFLSPLDFDGKGDNRIALWAMTNTSSLLGSSPSIQLKNIVLTDLNPADTYQAPAGGVDQKPGPYPLGQSCSCSEEQLNPNDDRMNEVMFTNGVLWGAVNTNLDPIQKGASGPLGDPRTGIMYWAVKPGLDTSNNPTATILREGYVQVPRESVMFPSIGATPAGSVVMSFSMSGVDYYPSAAWTELDALGPKDAPVVHISANGTAPEDGFTGYGTCAEVLPTQCPALDSNTNVARWGDYSFTSVDEAGTVWSANEYIPAGPRDANAGNWGTWIEHITPATTGPAAAPSPSPAPTPAPSPSPSRAPLPNTGSGGPAATLPLYGGAVLLLVLALLSLAPLRRPI